MSGTTTVTGAGIVLTTGSRRIAAISGAGDIITVGSSRFPDVTPSYSTALSVDMSVLETAFGEGYTQRVPNGINSVKETWRVVWTDIDKGDALAMENFIRARKGATPFGWTPPDRSTAKRYVCKRFSNTPSAPDLANFSADFEEDFG